MRTSRTPRRSTKKKLRVSSKILIRFNTNIVVHFYSEPMKVLDLLIPLNYNVVGFTGIRVRVVLRQSDRVNLGSVVSANCQIFRVTFKEHLQYLILILYVALINVCLVNDKDTCSKPRRLNSRGI